MSGPPEPERRPRVRLIHWNAAEAAERAALLLAAGVDVEAGPFAGPAEALWSDPPGALWAAVVIDLSRLPSHGREVAMAVRSRKTTRHLPLLFVDGAPEKVARAREQLPDAVFTTWSEIPEALPRALASPPADPIVPRSNLDGYSGTPLPKKLGIKPGSTVLLAEAPETFEATLGDLPAGAVLLRDECLAVRAYALRVTHYDLLLWFTRSRAELEQGVAAMGARAGAGGLWILWPKKASGIVSDLSEAVVRQTGLAAGLVDYKIAAVDATWSGLRFARRRAPNA